MHVDMDVDEYCKKRCIIDVMVQQNLRFFANADVELADQPCKSEDAQN